MKYKLGKVAVNSKGDFRVYIKTIIESKKITKFDGTFLHSLASYHENACFVSNIESFDIRAISINDMVDNWDDIQGWGLACKMIDGSIEWFPWTYCLGRIKPPSKELTRIAFLESKIQNLQKELLGYQAKNDQLRKILDKIKEETLSF